MLTHLPTVVGLTLCEDVVADPATRNLSLIRSFTGLGTERFPAVARPFCVVASFADGSGEAEARLRVAVLEDGVEEVYQVRSRLSFPDRLRIVYYVMRLTRCPLPKAGLYLFTLELDGEWVAHHALRVYVSGIAS
jgi:hypothetical protein